MIAALLMAERREEFVSAVRALDRVLISGFYVIPLFHLPQQWIARWTTVERPPTPSLYGQLFESSWRQDPPRQRSGEAASVISRAVEASLSRMPGESAAGRRFRGATAGAGA